MDIPKGIEACKRIVVRGVALEVAKETGCSTEDAMREFLVSDTYRLVQDSETRLWAESPLYVVEWYRTEKKNRSPHRTSAFDNL